MRTFLLLVLFLADVLLLPSVVQLPAYVTPARQDWATWLQVWALHPIGAAQVLFTDATARSGWLMLQPMALAALIWIWVQEAAFGEKPREAKRDASGVHGNARWRTQQELADTFSAARVGAAPPVAGIVAGADRQKRPRTAWLIPGPQGKAAKTNPHVLVLGGSGAGKTRRLVLPNLWMMGQAKLAGHESSMVVTDPKGELYAHSADYFRSLGYQVCTLNLIDPRRSHRFNPIAEIAATLRDGDQTAATEAAWDIAHTFAALDSDSGGHREDPFWQNAAESIIAAVVMYVADYAPAGQRTMATAYRMLTECGKDGGDHLDRVFQSLPAQHPARLAYGVTQLSGDRARSAILTTAAVKLKLFADPTVVAMTAGHDYPLESLGSAPAVVYLMLPDDKSGRNALAAVYLAQTYSTLSRLASESATGRLPVPVYWFLDEFANISSFKDFDKMISVMRGKGMAAMIVLQALQQLDARYGKETAAVITANCDTWLFLRTNDQSTAQEISEKLGQYTVRTQLTSASTGRHDSSSGTNEQLSGRPLLSPDEVLRWPMGKALVLQAGQFPAEIALADVSEWPAKLVPGGPPPVRIDPPVPEPWLPHGGQSGHADAQR